MTFPTVQATATSLEDAANVTSHTVTLPAGIVAGDLLIIFFSTDGSPAITWPSGANDGFTEIFSLNNGTNNRLGIAYRQANGLEPATVEVATSGSQRSAHISYRITGHVNPSSQAPEASTGVTGVNNAPNPDSLTPTGGAKDYLWLATHGRDGDRTIVTFSTNYLGGISTQGSGAESAGVAAAERDLNAASENPGSFSFSNADEWVACTVAVHPAAIEGGIAPLMGGLTEIGAIGEIGSITGPRGFLPTLLPGLELWLRADTISGLNDGDPVVTWNDESGNSNDASQTTAAKRPTFQTNEQNGLPIVRFDGVDDFFEANGVAPAFTGEDKPISFFCIINAVDDASSNRVPFGIGRDTDVNPRIEMNVNSAEKFSWVRKDDAAVSKGTGVTVNTIDATSIASVIDTGTTASVFINGGVELSDKDVDVGTTTLDEASVGAANKNNFPSAFLSGDLGEVIVYSAALSTEDQQQVELYLSLKWGISLV